MTELKITKVDVTACCRMLNSRACYMAGVLSCAHRSTAVFPDTMHN